MKKLLYSECIFLMTLLQRATPPILTWQMYNLHPSRYHQSQGAARTYITPEVIVRGGRVIYFVSTRSPGIGSSLSLQSLLKEVQVPKTAAPSRDACILYMCSLYTVCVCTYPCNEASTTAVPSLRIPYDPLWGLRATQKCYSTSVSIVTGKVANKQQQLPWACQITNLAGYRKKPIDHASEANNFWECLAPN